MWDSDKYSGGGGWNPCGEVFEPLPLDTKGGFVAFRKASRDGLIVCVGLTTSKRAPRHASAQRVWIGKGMVA
jgi:hypothetical protein